LIMSRRVFAIVLTWCAAFTGSGVANPLYLHSADEMPRSRDVSQPTIPQEGWSPPSSLHDLPEIDGLPDLMRFADGSIVRTKDDWIRRRDELKAMIQFYEYGHIPPAPNAVSVEELVQAHIADGDAVEERMTLVIDSGSKLRMKMALYRPKAGARLPVIVREEHALGHLEEVPQIIERNYMFVEFAREDLAPDRPAAHSTARSAYPDHDWGTLAVWAWGAMRVVDYLESRNDVDLARIGIAGHSRGGKMALLAGALDERFSLVAANGSGCGGAGCFRIGGDRVETLELITREDRFGYWFHPRLREFADSESRLPIDQHFLKALVAPRALICTDALSDQWANPAGNRATSKAAQVAFDLMDAADKNGLHFRWAFTGSRIGIGEFG
jgi:dienelactone hydrolase